MTTITVGLGSCGIAAGASKTYKSIEQWVEANGIEAKLKKTSCIGMCFHEPLVEIKDDKGSYLYEGVVEKDVQKILEQHITNKAPILDRLVKSDVEKTKGDSYFEGQTRIVLRNCGLIDPEILEDYEARDGYAALKKIATEKISSEDIIKEMLASGMRGRGGGGFPTGMKWKFAASYPSDEKYIICNADEGDPGAFMDRSVLEGDPHSVIEGMIIGAYAMGATSGYVYCRAEYPLAIVRVNKALEQARERGYLGKNIQGIEGFNFDMVVKEGAGAFVCGEETALMASIEGQRGMPRKRPPFPAESGLWKKPSNINNVETFASVAWIINHGGAKYALNGTEKSKGTKVFALAGKIKNSGLVEVPMGVTLNDIIYKLGGGILEDKEFKAVQLGGPSGGCIPASLGDTIVDYDSLMATGAIMGSGGMVVMDEASCMVDVAKYFLQFTQNESCGKCTFCRIGTKRMLEILERITHGQGVIEDITKLEELAAQIKDSSLCGLGQTAPNPVLATLRYFRHEYEAHIIDKKCPALVCKPLITYTVDETNCTGCTLCARKCPTNCISGERKALHLIDQEACIQCGACFTACNFKAITRA
jgi:NADH-quinone oxidoreductase subunit F